MLNSRKSLHDGELSVGEARTRSNSRSSLAAGYAGSVKGKGRGRRSEVLVRRGKQLMTPARKRRGSGGEGRMEGVEE
jgi:hypothetical protein